MIKESSVSGVMEHTGGKGVSDLVSDAQDCLADAGSKGYRMAQEKIQKAGDAAKGYVKQNPWYALGIAVGIGALLGMLLHGSHHD